MTADPIQLGPWELHDAPWRGGFATVWRGAHRAQGIPAAIKVMHEGRLAHPDARADFQREVQLAAGLDHPHIVLVLDHGEVPAQGVEGVPAGAPYLVMELAQGGDLADTLEQRVPDWAELKELLLQLLDALAHAHARGVIHRDIKPGNVLYFPEQGWKLTDFGIAHPVDQLMDGLREPSRGTPYYMAPEQFLGLFRDYGPWTDLYALGCMIWTVVHGAPPFVAQGVDHMARLHIKAALPPLQPRMRVPGGLRAWLQRALAKKPSQRFQRAADAARALDELRIETAAPVDLGSLLAAPLQDLARAQRALTREVVIKEPTQDVARLRLPQAPALPDLPAPPSLALRANRPRPLPVEAPRDAPTRELPLDSTPEPEDALDDALEAAEEVSEAYTPSRRPVPESWRREGAAPRPIQLVGAGLALFGLRALPLVGREAERDVLWGALQRAWQEGRPQAVIINGPAGRGKSRLTAWLALRAHETGAATVLRATHDADLGPGHGLGAMLALHLRTTGLDAAETSRRAARWLKRHDVTDPLEAQALTTLLREGESDPQTSLRFASVRQRHAVLRRTLERIAQERTLVAWLDDAQWNPEALAFVHACIEHPDPLPILFILTLQDESLALQPDAEALLDELRELPAVTSLPLEPLPPQEIRRLIDRMLTLAPHLASALAKRAEGNPLFAIQIVSHWIEHDMLEVRGSAFTLRPGVKDSLPDSLHHTWGGLVEHLLASRSSSDRDALEIAAVLGLEVDRREWRDACALASCAPSPDLDAALVARRLASWTERGFAFAHSMLRESILRTAREARRLPWHALACGQMLDQAFENTQNRRLAERAGRFLLTFGIQGLGSGQEAAEPNALFSRAAELLRIGAAELRNQGEFERALDALDQHSEALYLLDDPTGPAHVEELLLRAEIHKLRGEHDAALDRVQRALDLATDRGWERLRGEGLLTAGDLDYRRGAMEQARALASQALEIFRGADFMQGVAYASQLLARVAARQGDFAAAADLFQRAADLFPAELHPVGRASVLMGRGDLQLQRGALEEAEALFDEAHRLYEQQGVAHSMAAALNAAGELARARGDLDAAERRYRQVIQLFEAMGAADADVPRLNLAIVHLRRARYDDARALLEPLRDRLEAAGSAPLLASVHIGLLPCYAASREWRLFDAALAEGQTLLLDSGAADKDDANAAQLAGELAEAVGEPGRASDALNLALYIATRLGDDARAEALLLTLAELEG